MTSHPYWTYSREVLSFRFPGRDRAAMADLPGEAERERLLGRVMDRLADSGRRNVVLLGLGCGALAADLAGALPPDARLTVCDAYPERVQAVLENEPERVAWWTPGGNRQLLTDNSPWALLLLLAGFAGGPGDTLCMHNPELAGLERKLHGRVQRLFAAAGFAPGAGGENPPAMLSVGAILRPDEPDLDGFLAHFPDWLHEVVLVWDAEEVPDHGLATAAPLRQAARPLGGDFAAQRNAMLDACSGDWVLYLDADERLPPKAWAGLSRFLGGPGQGLDGYWFPRLTLYPDAGHCMAGMGSWPDLQLRLFRRAGARFKNPVHERLAEPGATGILCALPIVHSSHLRKDREAWLAKLSLYDQAAASNVRHRLNTEYPRLELGFFTSLISAFPADAALTTEA